MENLVLPPDSRLRAQLEVKLAEYEHRNQSSPLPPVHRQRAYFKEEALRTLLRYGVLDIPSLAAEGLTLFGDQLDMDALREALGILRSYCAGDPKRVEGGTGLPDPKHAHH